MQPNHIEKNGLDHVSSTPSQEHGILEESRSPVIQGLERIITEIAPTEIPVLLVGESGSGKEVLALRIHRLSRRCNEPFLKVNCSLMASDRLEDSFRADNGENGMGAFSTAGTVFLDEIGDLDIACQSKLLHVMPDGDTAQGHGRRRPRVITATSRNLEEEIRSGRFREELYYRLNGVFLRLPPLRRRKEDIPGFVELFLTRYAAQFGRPKPFLSPQTLRNFLEYTWPGNIRQLENAVKKIVALGDERLAKADITPSASESRQPSNTVEGLSLKQASRAASRQAERELILKALERTRWNRKRAAKELQISYKALLYKLKQIGLEDSARAINPRGEGQ